MDVTIRKTGEIDVLAVTGKLDSTTSPEFESRIIPLIDAGGRKLLVDCAGLDYISSAGLRVLLLAAKKLKAADGAIALAGLKEPVREVFEIAGFTSLFPIYPSAEDALRAL